MGSQASGGRKPVKDGFLAVGRVEDFAAATMRAVRIASKPIAVFRRPERGFFAREMACKHQNADLTRSPMVGDRVTCERHGWQYDVMTGECLNQSAPRLREHEVVIEDGWVLVAVSPSARG